MASARVKWPSLARGAAFFRCCFNASTALKSLTRWNCPPATLITLLVHSFFALRGSSAGFTYLITNGPMPWTWIIVSAGVQA